MARLFVSFYLFIAASLIGVAALLNTLFYHDVEGALQERDHAVHLLTLIQQEHPEQLPSLITRLGWTSVVVDKDNIALSEAQRFQWQQQRYLLVEDGEDQAWMYVEYDARHWVKVSLPHQHNDSSLWWYSGLFFLLLAALIALWLWPLWRDLATLERAALSLQQDGSLPTLTLKKTSAITTIAQAFNHLGKQVKTLLQTQRELSGAVAHELRTPLSRMKFALANQVDETRWRDLKKDVNELEQLVQEMLDYASMETTTPELNFGSIPVYDLLQQVRERLQSTSEKTIDIKPCAIELNADAHFIERAVQNIVSNALRYTNTTVLLSVVELDNAIQILCDDDGPGVPESERERIFDAFYRPDTSRDRRRGGAGLGLAIVKRIQRWHDGDCWVEASPSGGARFVLFFKK